MWGKELPIILPQGGPLSPPVRPRHFTLGCDLTGGHASLVVQSEAPFLPLNPPAASGERHHQCGGVNVHYWDHSLPPLTAPGGPFPPLNASNSQALNVKVKSPCRGEGAEGSRPVGQKAATASVRSGRERSVSHCAGEDVK